MGVGQTIRMLQKQKLSPLQRLTVELVGIPLAELDLRLDKELSENPYLELDTEQEIEPQQQQLSKSGDTEGVSDYSDYWLGSSREGNFRASSEDDKLEPQIASTPLENFADGLFEQLRLSNISEREREIGKHIIYNLDSRGYFTRTYQAIEDEFLLQYSMEVSVEEVRRVLELVRTFEPAGVGARDLVDCLMLQLDRMEESSEVRLAKEILTNYAELFFNREFETLKRRLDVSDDRFDAAIGAIRALNPYPGCEQESLEDNISVEPDFVLWQQGGEVRFALNRPKKRHLKVSTEGERMLKGLEKSDRGDERTLKFLKEKLDSARLFIEAFNKRDDTLRSIMGAIVSIQKEYFQSGDRQKLKPMKYEDIRLMTGYDESTVSRMANSKRVQTPFGTILLRTLFSTAVVSSDGSEASSEAVRALLGEIIASEDSKHPFTDENLRNALAERGYELSRRTVAKYRERLGIPIAGKRKEK